MEQSSSWEGNRSSASRRISLIPRLMYPFRNMFKFLRWGAVNASPNPQPEGPPLVGCPRLFTQYIPSDPPYLDAVPATATWRRAMPWWQGPTYRHVIFVTYIFIFCRQRTFTRRTGGHCLDLWSTPSSRHYCIRILRDLFPVTTPVTWRLSVVTDIHKTTFREPADLWRIPRLMSFPWLLRNTCIWNWCSSKLAWCLIPVVFKGRLESYIYIYIYGSTAEELGFREIIGVWSRNPPRFMKPEGLSTWSCSTLAESNLHPYVGPLTSVVVSSLSSRLLHV